MFNRLKQALLHNYFGKQFPLDYRVYMVFFFESYLISILSALTNTGLPKRTAGLLLQWGYIGFCTVLTFVAPRIRLKLERPHLLFVTFFYIPFLYFHTAGYQGTALMFAPLGLFLLCVVFGGKKRLLAVALNILLYLGCILVSWFYPQTVTHHVAGVTAVFDLAISAILSFSGLAVLTIFISKTFEDHNKTLSELSVRDALTGAYNRRFLMDFLQRELEIARQTKDAFYVLMMDLDHFKQVNDTYGHSFGDNVLTACVQAVRGVLRKDDVIARYGGEEFVVILVPKMAITVTTLAERIRRAVAQLRFSHDVRITISIGVAKYQPDDTVEALINRADNRLYQAKQAGRNRVVFKCEAPLSE